MPASSLIELVLASASPRRAELLGQIGVVFRVQPCEVDETPREGEPPLEYLTRVVALKLAAAHAQIQHPNCTVLCADTIVHLESRILGKPQDHTEARAHLQHLAGKTHVVSTRFCVVNAQGLVAQTVSSAVRVVALNAAQIARYVAGGEGEGKAGGYAIQGAFARHIAHLEGSYSAVMGLPVHEVAAALRALGAVGDDF